MKKGLIIVGAIIISAQAFAQPKAISKIDLGSCGGSAVLYVDHTDTSVPDSATIQFFNVSQCSNAEIYGTLQGQTYRVSQKINQNPTMEIPQEFLRAFKGLKNFDVLVGSNPSIAQYHSRGYADSTKHFDKANFWINSRVSNSGRTYIEPSAASGTGAAGYSNSGAGAYGNTY